MLDDRPRDLVRGDQLRQQFLRDAPSWYGPTGRARYFGSLRGTGCPASGQSRYAAQDGSTLWILDNVGTRKSLLTIDETTGKVIATVLASDTSLIAGAWSLAQPRKGDIGTWLFDANSRKMLFVVPSRRSPSRLNISRDITLQSNALLTSPAWRDAATLMSPGFLPSGRLVVFDSTGRLLRTLGVTPSVGRLPVRVSQHAYQSTLATNSSRSRFVLATRYADRVEIFSRNGPTQLAERPFGFDPTVTEANTRNGPIANLQAARFGYVNVTADDDHIFALFSGKLSRRFHGRENYGRYIHVFDWDGKLVQVAQLDQESIALALHPSSKTLYAVGAPPDPQVRSYPLRSLVSPRGLTQGLGK